MQFTGKITKITPEISVGAKNLPKITFVVEEVGDMEDFKRNSLAVDILGEKTALIKQYKEGDVVKVDINVKHSEYNDKLYNRVTAWRIDAADGSSNGNTSSTTTTTTADDDLPF